MILGGGYTEKDLYSTRSEYEEIEEKNTHRSIKCFN